MLLTARDDRTRYLIRCPATCRIKLDAGGTDYVVVPDPLDSEVPYWLFDEILVEAARCGEFGLELLLEEPLAKE